MTDLRVVVVREGSRVDEFVGGEKVSRAICSSIVLVEGGGHNILVDVGARGYAGELLLGLEKNGLKPDDVDVVINTHQHLDHSFNNFLFDKAAIYTTMGFWPPGEDRVDIYGDITRADVPCVKLVNTPGHCDKHVSVVAESGGKTVVVAGDAVRESIIKEGVLPDRYTDKHAYLKSMKKIFDIADVIIPGHGKKIEGQHLLDLKEKLKQFT